MLEKGLKSNAFELWVGEFFKPFICIFILKNAKNFFLFLELVLNSVKKVVL